MKVFKIAPMVDILETKSEFEIVDNYHFKYFKIKKTKVIRFILNLLEKQICTLDDFF